MSGLKCRLAVCLSWLVAGVCAYPVAHAQQDEVSAPVTPNVGEARPPVIVPPKLKQFIEPVYPPDALAQGISGRVEIEMVIGVDGKPNDLRLKTPAGHGFDEAALAAAQQLSFEPATRDGVPIAARVVLPYAFEFKPPPPPEEQPPPPARIEGRVLEPKNQVPIAGAEVIISSPDQKLVRRGTTDAQGHFSFEGFPSGSFQLTIAKPEWVTLEATETLVEGESTEVVYRLQEAPDLEAFGATARIPPPPREVTRRSIPKEELTRIPGTRGDALRTVELLPGVARPPFGTGQLIVRGSAPADTQFLLDGIPVAALYHFGGLTSFINSRLLESVDFYPGNFSVRYGRRRGGIVEATLADPARDRFHGVLDLSLIDGSIFAQGPITRNWDFAAAARRSWIDVVLGTALESTDVDLVAAPVYYDYQLLTTYRPSDDDRLRLTIYGSSDNFKLLFQQPSDMNQAISGNFKLETEFHRAHASWARKISDRVDHDLEVAAGIFRLAFGVGQSFDFSSSGGEVYARSEWRARVTEKVRLIAGLDLALQPIKVSYDGPALQQQEGTPENGTSGTALANRSRQAAETNVTIVQPALYLESNLDLGPLRFILGSRLDY